MFWPTARVIMQSTAARSAPRAPAPLRRFLSTAPPTKKSRSWKSLAGRLGIGTGIIYYYNTTDVFAEDRQYAAHPTVENEAGHEQLLTIEALAQERKQRKVEQAAAPETAGAHAEVAPAEGAEELEEEAGQQGAFDPVTGEINWDCPCLGGMAHGPCGEEFKTAFSCFVHSTEEPKGMDCVDKFKGMQTCFREYPEIYGSEAALDDEDDVTADDAQAEAANSTETSNGQASTSSHQPLTREIKADDREMVPDSYKPGASSTQEQDRTTNAPARRQQDAETVVPKAALDATAANKGIK